MSALLEVKNLKVHFPVKHGMFSRVREFVKAVDDVSFSIAPGETLGLVGESGCGKTTLGRAIVRLVEPTAGSVSLDGEDITQMSGSALRARRRKFQMIFQDPYGSLNPRMTVEQIVGEALDIHKLTDSKSARQKRIFELLKDVGLDPVYAQRYPHEFSGGQRQRIGIARALAVEPELIICDEPVSALDVSVQAQIINLLQDLQQQRGIAYLFIAHDLAVVEHISHRVMVMYLGKIVETADAKALIRDAATSLHAGADFRRAGGGSRNEAAADCFAGRRAVADSSAARLSVPSALSDCRGALQDGCSAVARNFIQPLGCVSSGKAALAFQPPFSTLTHVSVKFLDTKIRKFPRLSCVKPILSHNVTL